MIKKFLFCTLLGLMMTAHAEIREIHSIEEIRPFLVEDALVIFDVDLVLLETSEPAFQMVNLQKHKKVVREIMGPLSPERRDELLNKMLDTDAILVEEGTLLLFSELKKRGIKSIALTASYTGAFGKIPDMGNWRVEMLQSFGYDFTYSFPELDKVTFKSYPSVNGDHPRFDRGVLFANGGSGKYTKGDVLMTFFEHANILPKKILFVDDRRHYLEGVEAALPEGVEFQGFHYLGASELKAEPITEEAFRAVWEKLQ